MSLVGTQQWEGLQAKLAVRLEAVFGEQLSVMIDDAALKALNIPAKSAKVQSTLNHSGQNTSLRIGHNEDLADLQSRITPAKDEVLGTLPASGREHWQPSGSGSRWNE